MGAMNHELPTTERCRSLPPYFWLVAAVLSLVCIVPIWLCGYFPSQNGPSLLLISFMQHEFDNPAFGYSSHFDWHVFPVPYLLQNVGLNLLFLVFSPLVAHKIWVSLVVLLRPCALFYFLRRLGRGREIYGLACLPLLYDFSLMRGYMNFHAGVSIGLIVFGYFLKHRQAWSVRSTLLFNALVLLQYFTHPVALAVTGLLLAAFEFAATRSPARVVGVVFRGYIPSLVLLAAFLGWSFRYGAWVDPDVKFLTISDKVQNVFYRGATALSPVANLLSLALLGAVGAVAVWALLRRHGQFTYRKWYVNPNVMVKEPMLVVLLAVGLLYLLMPWDMIGWHKADVRIIPFIFMMVLAIPRPIAARRGQVAFCAVAAAVTLATLIPITQGLRSRSDEVAEYLAGISAVPPRAKLLPLSWADPRSEDWELSYGLDPLKRADAYYALARGGASGNSLARNNTLYWIWYKDYRNLSGFPTVDTEAPAAEQIEAAAAAYDAILLWRSPAEVQNMFRERGFQGSFKRGNLTVLTKPTVAARRVVKQ